MPLVGVAHAIQHQLFATVEMQREPVPAALVGGEGLAAPFAVHPGKAGDGDGLVVDGDLARRGIEELDELAREDGDVGGGHVKKDGQDSR